MDSKEVTAEEIHYEALKQKELHLRKELVEIRDRIELLNEAARIQSQWIEACVHDQIESLKRQLGESN